MELLFVLFVALGIGADELVRALARSWRRSFPTGPPAQPQTDQQRLNQRSYEQMVAEHPRVRRVRFRRRVMRGRAATIEENPFENA